MRLTADPPFLQPRIWRIDRLAPDASIHITDRDVALAGGLLSDLTEAMTGTVTLSVVTGDDELASRKFPVELLGRSEWGGAGSMAELLAAFVTPNDPAIDRVLKAASEVLRRAGKKDGIDGYAGKSRTRVWELASALWSAVASFRISYALPPASFETVGQKIRTPSAILENGIATCLDTALLFGTALEQAGLNPLVVVTQGHAFVGVSWLHGSWCERRTSFGASLPSRLGSAWRSKPRRTARRQSRILIPIAMPWVSRGTSSGKRS